LPSNGADGRKEGDRVDRIPPGAQRAERRDCRDQRRRVVVTDLVYVDGRGVELVAGQPFATAPVALNDPVPARCSTR